MALQGRHSGNWRKVMSLTASLSAERLLFSFHTKLLLCLLRITTVSEWGNSDRCRLPKDAKTPILVACVTCIQWRVGQSHLPECAPNNLWVAVVVVLHYQLAYWQLLNSAQGTAVIWAQRLIYNAASSFGGRTITLKTRIIYISLTSEKCKPSWPNAIIEDSITNNCLSLDS